MKYGFTVAHQMCLDEVNVRNCVEIILKFECVSACEVMTDEIIVSMLFQIGLLSSTEMCVQPGVKTPS